MWEKAIPAAKIRIVHAGRGYVVIDKPSGMLAVPGRGPDRAECAAAEVRSAFPECRGPLVVHRLDMDTSGLMVFGLTEDAQRRLSLQFEGRTVEKRYAARLAGAVRADRGMIDLPLRAEIARRPFQVVDAVHGRPATTAYRVLTRGPDETLVEFAPLTGRTHQLRVHAADPTYLGPEGMSRPPRPAGEGLGCPIIGDVLYGRGDDGARLMLHASYLSFVEPGGAKRVEFRSEAEFGV